MMVGLLKDGIGGQSWPPVVGGGDAEALDAARKAGIELRGGWGTITPSWAAEALRGARVPLPPSAADVVASMALDMEALRWRANGEAIVLTSDGFLLNGRKRLAACVKADVPFVALVVYGVSVDTFDTMNNLRGRRLSDILHIQGEPNHRSMASMLQLLWRMRDGGFDRSGPMGSDRQLLALLDQNPKIRESLAFAGARGRLIRLPLFAALHFLLHRIDHERAIEFFRGMMDDGWAISMKAPEKRLREGHPARAINDLINHSRSVGEGLDRNRLVGAAALSLAWRAYVQGVPAKVLRWLPVDAGGVAQPFPSLEGWTPEMDLVPKLALPVHGGIDGEATDIDVSMGTSVGAAEDIMSSFERHPHSDEVWQAAFPDGVVPVVSLRMFTPSVTKAVLDKNTANRSKVSTIVARYRRDMEAEVFESLNGDSIKIARTGRLLDGQHRLTGLEQAKETLIFLVVEGLDERVFDSMDRADTKTYADVLRDRNIANAGTVAAAGKLQYFYELNRFKSTSGLSLSVPELNDVIKRTPEIEGSFEFNNRLRGLLIPAVACWVEFRLMKACGELARQFLEKLCSGEDLKGGDPILVLRNRLHKMHEARLKERRGGGKTKGIEEEGSGGPDVVRQSAITILAFNFWAQGKCPIQPQMLSWKGTQVEDFPDIVVPENWVELREAVKSGVLLSGRGRRGPAGGGLAGR